MAFLFLDNRSRRARPTHGAGYTIVETMVAASIATIAITGLYVANASCLGIARAHQELIVADQCLQQRAEQFRAANWLQVTDPNSVSTLFNVSPVINGALDGQTEQVTINAYPPVIPATVPIVVTRSGTTTTIVSAPPPGFYLRNVLAVRADFQESWTSAQGHRTRVRQTSTVIALGGLFH